MHTLSQLKNGDPVKLKDGSVYEFDGDVLRKDGEHTTMEASELLRLLPDEAIQAAKDAHWRTRIEEELGYDEVTLQEVLRLVEFGEEMIGSLTMNIDEEGVSVT